MNSRGSFFSVYSRFNPRASMSLGLVPEHTTAIFSFKCTVHARAEPEPIAQMQPYITLLLPHRPNLQSLTGHNKNIQTRTSCEKPCAKYCRFFCSHFFSFTRGKPVRKGGKTWNVCGKLFQHLMEMHLLQVLRGAQRDGNKTHLEYFSFSGERLSPSGYNHTHTQDYRNRAFHSVLFYCRDTQSEIPELLFDVVILL